MDFELTEQQTAIYEMARGFAEEKMQPQAVAWDQNSVFPVEVMREAAQLGMAGIYVDEDLGGSGLSRLEATLIFEALAYGCPSTAAYISIHNMCAWMIASFGSEAQKQAWVADLCTMKHLTSYCLTEPGVGSDAAALSTRATPDNQSYTLNGTKSFISGATASDLYLVMARTGEDGPDGISCLLVSGDSEGLSFGKLENKMGWNTQPTAEVRFDNLQIPLENRLGHEGDGFKIAMQGLDSGRLNISACSLGGAQFALDKTVTYLQERRAFGKTLDQFQALQFRVADMQTELQAARIFLRFAAWKLDQGVTDARVYCAMAKRFVTDIAFRVANEALQLHGGYGYLQDFGLEKVVRDLRVHQILEGTNEIMRVIISRDIFQNR